MPPTLFGSSPTASRRTVLRSAGATLVLPFLPSALPRSAWGSAPPAAPIRLVVCVVPNGIYTPAWQPLIVGPSYDLLPIATPLAALQPRFSILSGAQNESQMETYNDHDPAMGSILTDTPIGESAGQPENGISFDQVAADLYGANTPFRSMQLGAEDERYTFGSVYSHRVSWGTANTPLPPIVDPGTAFSRMFGTVAGEGLSEEEAEAWKTMRSSILDHVLDRTTSLRARLSTTDLQKLDQYETGVRELELQIARLENIACEAPPSPGDNPAFAETTGIMYDLMHKALECDLTRYITFMQGPSVTDIVYSHLGLNETDHNLSHAAWYSDVARADRITMQTWQVQMFAAFMQNLADTTDVDGNDLLSNTICVFTSEFGEANFHYAYGDYGMPIGIGGGENAGIVQGLHRAIGAQSHANVWLALLNHLGVEQDTFGNHSTQPVGLTTS